MRHLDIGNDVKEFTVFGRKYFVNKSGTVFNRFGRQMSSHMDTNREYPYVEFRSKVNGQMARKKYYIHRLVAELFIPNPDGLLQVNHIDGDKENSHVSNLEWVTPSDNQLHSRYVLGNNTGFADTPVVCIELGKFYKSTKEAWRDTGVGYSHISECASGKRKTAGGYHWRYI